MMKERESMGLRGRMGIRLHGVVLVCCAVLGAFWSGTVLGADKIPDRPWMGVHLMLRNGQQAAALEGVLPDLKRIGVNTVVVEINYSFEFDSHTELRTLSYVGKEEARRLGRAARKAGVRLIPQFNCLGHQSWAGATFPLLARYPELDETPGQYPKNEGIYCRSWCPLHPKVNPIVFALMDEMIEAFEADAFHVGMDEVFLIGSEHCARCRGQEAAGLFARAVKDYHGHLVKKRGVEMLMWADRLLDGKATGYGRWEAAMNGTEGAVDRIPKDIILCDWHYGKREEYPSIAIFLEKGFRVWPAGWDKPEATAALVEQAMSHRENERLLGHLATTWGKAGPEQLVEFPPLRVALRRWKQGEVVP